MALFHRIKEIRFQFLVHATGHMGLVHYQVSLLKEQDSSTDVADGIQVVTGDENRRPQVPVHLPD